MALGLIDYILLYGLIIISLCIGLYFGVFKRSQTTDEYLLGNRQMKVVPVAISLIASQVSGVAMLGYSADVYVFGANFVWICLSSVITTVICGIVFVPVLVRLKAANIFQYLEQRFDRRIMVMVYCVFTLKIVLYCAICAYIPGIAFAQATGANQHIVSIIVCTICVLYTTIGGFKAVIWTDVFQFLGIISSLVAIIILGIISAGGVSVVLEKASRGHRLDFNYSIDLTKRDGFWQMTVGCTITNIFFTGINPCCVQKYVSVSQFRNVIRVMVLYCIGAVVINFLCTFIGITMYAIYSRCDPISTGEVSHIDQILSYFVMDIGRNVPGLPGIFFGGLFSASLSTLSSYLNTLAATTYGDLVSSFISKDTLQGREGWILKLLVVIFGSVCTILTLFLDRMGGLLPFIVSTTGLVYGIFVGLFSLGIMFPVANSKGAFIGAISTFFSVGTITVLSQYYTLQGAWRKFAKPVSVAGCIIPLNITLPRINLDYEEPFILFRISFWYISAIGALMVILIGLLVSWFTKTENSTIDPDLLCSIFHKNYNRDNSTEYVAGVQRDNDSTYNFQQDLQKNNNGA